MYEVFEHTADVGLRVRADSVEDLFADAAAGLLSLMVANPESVEGVLERTIEVQSDAIDLLLFDWLSELLFVFESDGLLLSQFEIGVTGTTLVAKCRGELMNLGKHRMDHEVKAVTYHQLQVEQIDGSWVAEVILDI